MTKKSSKNELKNIVIIKFGGKSLGDSAKVRNLAKKTAELCEQQPVVVASDGPDQTFPSINSREDLGEIPPGIRVTHRVSDSPIHPGHP